MRSSPGTDVGGITIPGRPTPMNERSALHCTAHTLACRAWLPQGRAVAHRGISRAARDDANAPHTHTHTRARAPSPESPLVLQGRVHDGRVCSDAVGCAGRIADKWSQIGRDTADSSKRAHRRDRRCRRAALPMRSLGLLSAHSRTRTHTHARTRTHTQGLAYTYRQSRWRTLPSCAEEGLGLQRRACTRRFAPSCGSSVRTSSSSRHSRRALSRSRRGAADRAKARATGEGVTGTVRYGRRAKWDCAIVGGGQLV